MKKKTPTEAVREAAIVVRRRGRVLLLQRREGQRWAGLWDFPRFAVDTEVHGANNGNGGAAAAELCRKTAQAAGVTVKIGGKLATLLHSVTRFRITLDCYHAEYVAEEDQQQDLPPRKWLRPAELEHVPLCTTGRKLSQLIAKQAV